MTRLELQVRFLLAAMLFVVAVGYAFEATTFRQLGMYAPVTAGSLGVLLFGIITVREAWRLRQAAVGHQREYGRSEEYVIEVGDGLTWDKLGFAARQFLFLIVLIAAVWAFGLIVAGCTYVVLMLRFEARRSWLFIAVAVVCVIAFFWVFALIFGFRWPQASLVALPI